MYRQIPPIPSSLLGAVRLFQSRRDESKRSCKSHRMIIDVPKPPSNLHPTRCISFIMEMQNKPHYGGDPNTHWSASEDDLRSDQSPEPHRIDHTHIIDVVYNQFQSNHAVPPLL